MRPLLEAQVRQYFGKPLSAEAIFQANKVPAQNQGAREYGFHHFQFRLEDKVFKPSKTGQILHEMLFNSDLTGKKLIIMGTGCGVEPVVSAYRNATNVYACDIHPESVSCAQDNYQKNVPETSTTQTTFYTSDLFKALPENIQADLICFDPPAVKVQFSNEPDQIRSSCTGASIVNRFFSQISEKGMLHPHGKVHIVLSNTADQELIVHDAYEKGFAVQNVTTHTWNPPYQNVTTLHLEFISHMHDKPDLNSPSMPVFAQKI